MPRSPRGARGGAVNRALIAGARTLGVIAALLAVPAPAQSPEALTAPAAAPQVLVDDSLRVAFWGEDRGLAQRTLQAARAPLPLPGLPSAARLERATIYLAPSPAIFDSLTGGRIPGWAAGVAVPGARAIVLPVFDRRRSLGDPVVTLRHEIAHLALAAYLGPNIPRWFTEGYATWVSGDWDESSGWQIRLALLRGTASPLDSLTLAWPRNEARARLAYLLSASAVRHLATFRGEQAFRAFMEEWRRVGSMDTAMRTVYHMSLTQFEDDWRGMVRRRYGWLLALSQIGVFWGGFALLIIILGTLRRRRNRERLEALRREEYMLPPPTEELPEIPGESRSAPGSGVDADVGRE